MADIQITKPAAGQPQNVPAEAGARYVFDPDVSVSNLEKSGEDLVLNFEDGSQLFLQDFYGEYDAENQPTFILNGQELNAETFFSQLDASDDVIPAAGFGGAGAGAAANARYHSYDNLGLAEGIDHLWQLDWGMGRAFDNDEEFNSWGYRGDDYFDGGTPPERPDNPVTIVPEYPNRPDYPDSPTGTDPNNPHDPGLPPDNPNGSLNNDLGKDVLTVYEKYLGNGTEAGKGPLTVSGAMLISAPDGVATIQVGGVTVWANGSLTSTTVIPTDEGRLVITGFDPAAGKLTYDFTLEHATGEHGRPGVDSITHGLTVVVTDTDGDMGASSIKINVVDDVPQALDDRGHVEAGETISGNVLDNDAHGADGKGQFSDGATVRWDAPAGAIAIENGYVIEYPNEGVLTIYNDGSYVFVSDADADTGSLPAIDYTIIDSDGDTTKAQLVIDINNKPTIGPDPGPNPDPGPDPGPDPEDPDRPGDPGSPSLKVSEVTVDESKLADGTQGGQGDRTTAGSFRVDTHTEGGQLVLSFGGSKITITLDGTDSGAVPANNSFATEYGVFTVTSVSNGVVHYTYTLNSAYTDNVDEQGRNTVGNAEHIKVNLTDNVGHDVAKPGTIVVNIIDDVPVITGVDAGGVLDTEISGSTDFVSGSLSGVITGMYGADGKAASGALLVKDADGNYREGTPVEGSSNSFVFDVEGGKLTITDNGNGAFAYSYAPDDKNESIEKRDFDVQIKDSDGDIANATISVNLNYKPSTTHEDPKDPNSDHWANGGKIVVDEGALDDGTKEHDEHGTSGAGAFKVNLHGEDGVITLTQGGQILEIKIVNGEPGGFESLTFNDGGVNITFAPDGITANGDGTWTINYTYELATAGAHDDKGQSGENDKRYPESIKINVKDSLGNDVAKEQQITIEVHDDAPVISDPVLVAGADTVYEKAEDGKTDTDVAVKNAVQDTAETITLKLDSLTLGADNDANGNEADGKSVPSALTITVANQTFTFDVTTGPDGVLTFNSPQEGADGASLAISANDAGGYTLVFKRPDSDVQKMDEVGNLEHSESDTYNFVITVTDADGDTVSKEITVSTNVRPNIGDTPPPPEGENPPKHPNTTELENTKVVVDEADLGDGTGHGDEEHTATATNSFLFTTHGEGGKMILSFGGQTIEFEVDEKDNLKLVEGQTVEELIASLPKIETNHGIFTITGVANGKVEFKYDLGSEWKHDQVEEPRNTTEGAETIKVTLIDNIGNDRVSGDITVDIIDDVPEIAAPTLFAGADAVFDKDDEGNTKFIVAEDGTKTEVTLPNAVQDTAETITLNIDSLTLGADNDANGNEADGKSVPSALTITVANQTFTFDVTTGPDGVLTFNSPQEGADGTSLAIAANDAGGYTLVFTRPTDDVQKIDNAGNLEHSESDTYNFVITVTDADGDTATKNIEVSTNVRPNIGDTPPPPEGENPPNHPNTITLKDTQVTVDEALLEGGTKYEEGKSPSPIGESSFVFTTHGEGGKMILSFGDNKVEFEVDGKDNLKLAEGQTVKELIASLPKIITDHGVFTITGVANGKVEFTYELTDRFQHADGNGANTQHAAELVHVTLIDNIGHDQVSGDIKVNIIDDVPEISDLRLAAGDNELVRNQETGDLLTNTVYDSAEKITIQLDSLTLGADNDADGNAENGLYVAKAITVTVGENTYQFDVTTDTDGNLSFTPVGDEKADGSGIEITGNKTDGYKLVFTRPTADVQHENEKDGTREDSTADTYKFEITATDADGDSVSKDITVTTNVRPNIGDTPGGNTITLETTKVTVDESDLEGGTKHGPNDYVLTDNSSFVFTTHGEGGRMILEFGIHKIEFEVDGKDNLKLAEGQTAEDIINNLPSIETESGTFTITGVANGKVEFKFELNMKWDHEDGNGRKSEIAETVKVTLIDNIGHDSVSGNIKIDIIDDVPEFYNKGQVLDLDESGAFLLSDSSANHIDYNGIAGMKFNFGTGSGDISKFSVGGNGLAQQKISFHTSSTTTPEGDWIASGRDANTSRPTSQAMLGGKVQITASFVHYEFADNGYDIEHVFDANNLFYNSAKILDITSNGLTVGKDISKETKGLTDAWNNGSNEIALGGSGTLKVNTDASNYNAFKEAHGDTNTVNKAHVSEAVVFDLSKADEISHGVNINFGNSFANGDRVLLTFMLTGLHNSDDKIVQTTVIDKSYFDTHNIGDGTIQVKVPDGYTKLIVSALPTSDGTQASTGFNIKGIEFLNPVWSAQGQVEAISADGIGKYEWNFRDVFNQNDGKADVYIKGNKIAEYDVQITKDGVPDAKNANILHYEVKLLGSGTLNGEILFTATINKSDGTWTFKTDKEFEMLNGSNPFQILATDNDGDKAVLKLDIDPSFKRFQNEKEGFSVEQWSNSRNEQLDLADDIIKGEAENTLVFGKGGDDIILGDPFAMPEDGNVIKSSDDTVNKAVDALLNLKETSWDADTDLNKDSDKTVKNRIKTYNDDNIFSKLTPAQQAEFARFIEQYETDKAGADAIYGGNGNDVLFGGSGDDFLSGDKGSDIIYAGFGNDIITYDANDKYVNGGSGIDLVLAGKEENLHLHDMNNGDKFDNIEMLLKANTKFFDAQGITRQENLEEMGIRIDNISHQVHLDGWTKGIPLDDGNVSVYTKKVDVIEYTLEIKTEYIAEGTSRAAQMRMMSMSPNSSDAETGFINMENEAWSENTLEIAPLFMANDGRDEVNYSQNVETVLKNNLDKEMSSQRLNEIANVAALGITVTDAGITLDSGAWHQGDKPNVFESSDGAYTLEVADNDAVSLAAPQMTVAGDSPEGIDTLSSYIEYLENGEDSGNDLMGGIGMARAAYRPQPENTEGEDNQADTTRMDLTGHNVLDKGTEGDDVLAGGEEYDVIFGDAGDDLIFMDSSDFLVDGGDGLDIILVGSKFEGSLDEMLQNYADNKAGNGGYNENMPMVNDVEVMIKGDTDGVKSNEDLVKLGIIVEKDENGDKLTLDQNWEKVDDHTFRNVSDNLTIETSGNMSASVDDATQMITLQMQVNTETGGGV